jgi:glycosyltransferase involved in cell wall biosynthesis
MVVDGPIGSELEEVVSFWLNRLGPDLLSIVRLPENSGLGAALNKGLEYCRFDLVARMDTDDISLPMRFEKQVAFMVEHPEVSASSCYIEEWDAGMNQFLGLRKVPLESADVYTLAKRRCPLSHPAAIFRKSSVSAVGGYPPLRKAQDYALWAAMLQHGFVLCNIPDVLFKMRIQGDVSAKRGFEHLKAEYAILRYQRKVGFITKTDFLTNLTLRALLRLSPAPVRAFLYKIGR